MRQRVMIAMALASNPALLICDEPTTALDVTIQAQILELMQEIQRDTGVAILFITHDMGVVAEIADEVLVMKAGDLIERGEVNDIFDGAKAEYTRSLIAAVPQLASGLRAGLRPLPTPGAAEVLSGQRPDRPLPDPRRPAGAKARQRPCGRGCLAGDQCRRNPGAGGRVRLGQVDDRPGDHEP